MSAAEWQPEIRNIYTEFLFNNCKIFKRLKKGVKSYEYTSKNSLLLLSFHSNYNHSKQRYDMQFAQNTVLA